MRAGGELTKIIVGPAIIVIFAAYLTGARPLFPERVPDCIGERLDDALVKLNRNKFDHETEGVSGPYQVVMKQSPDPGSLVLINKKILLIYGMGIQSQARGHSLTQSNEEKQVVVAPTTFNIPVGTSVRVRLPTEINVDGVALPPSYTAELVSPIMEGTDVIASAGAPVVLDTQTALTGSSVSLSFGVREITDVEGHPFHTETNRVDHYRNISSSDRLAILMSSMAIGFVVGLLVDLFLLFLSLGMFAIFGVLIGLIVGIGHNNSATKETLSLKLEAGSIADFTLTEPAIVQLYRHGE